MPLHTEPSANNAVGSLLQAMLPRSRVDSETTRAISGQSGKRPDVLVTAPGRAPVVVEAEFMPASTVEPEARSRLGLKVAANDRTIEAAIAVRYPEAVRQADDLHAALRSARLSYCVFTQGKEAPTRFPESGWLDGNIEDLADMVRLVSVSQEAVDRAADILEQGIERAARQLDDVDRMSRGITEAIAELLGMSNVPQTRRMACAIIANALVFHERIAGMHAEVKPLRLVCGDSVDNPQGETLAAWDQILNINYWAIFAIAKDILEQLPNGYATEILRRLRDTAQAVGATGVENAHDLTGRVFQNLIADRKYLATFYTLPAAAALLARLAVAKLDGVDWSSAEAIGKLRIADFACGTGALLSAVYDQIAARHERAGGDAAALHKVMMEDVLYGCDVMPSAVHITSSTLSGMEPSVRFDNSQLYTLPYGRQFDGTVQIGSLELLQSSAVMTLFNTNDPARRTGTTGEETAANIIVDIPDEGYDLVIMNPPFTRNVTREGAYVAATHAAFAAFGASDQEQRDMAKRLERMKRGTCYHGNAGVASAFAALAHKKIKPGGVLALVLPLSVASGLAWEGLRQLLDENYTDLNVLSIAANGRDMSFSSETGMAECLVAARKINRDESPQDRVRFTSLSYRPQGFAHAKSIAVRILDGGRARTLEDGPYGGTPVSIGEEQAGETITATRAAPGEGWGAVRLSDFSLAQTAFALSDSRLWFPGAASALDLKTARIGDIGELGPYHLDIIGPYPRGPFNRARPSPTATYPALWNHNAKRETRIVCEPDSQLVVRQGLEEKAADIWATASRCHLNQEFTLGSQALAVAFTVRESLGSSVWPNVIFADKRFDYAISAWGNSTLGLLAYWWHSSRQQSAKVRMTRLSAASLPVLDFRALTDGQLRTAEAIFNEFRDKELKPAYLADADPNRALLDRRVVCDLLGFDEATYEGVRRLAAKWCAEPSVHGGKARPPGAGLVV